ncbi:glucose 1-dehydrogenase [Rouxiella sp. S1S-2]|uniref:SDR family NAD(P)-dependent oxidoreductase n=1 Tax=Rouxiella sp. S1S-2 TaxID=2653856 RepID=UPI001265367D|nr:glucose 1-dehydrogenase [Rouxiella sp. S1S-2]KAB7896885.1 glucose 1-dehydrogenase [Rouxiella sp. S1S-2]
MTTSSLLPSFSLAGKCALVTGGSRGIGQALASGLALAGASVVICGRELSTLEAVANTIVAQGGECRPMLLDMTRPDSFSAAFEAINLDADILINNAGTEQLCSSFDVDEALWDRIMDTNLKGAFFCAQAAAKRMAARGGGSILNLCSLTSQVGVPGAAAYGASKSAMVGLTHTLATEWASQGIRVNGIGPGYFQTELTAEFYQDAQWCESMRAKIPLGRFGKLEDLVGAAIFLSSPAAAYITGQVLYVDGGFLASI